MKYNINVEKSNGLVHVLFDYCMDEELATYPDLLAKMRRIKYMSVNNNTHASVIEITGGLRVYRPTLMDDLRALGFKYACFWMDGTTVVDGDMDNMILDWCESNTDWVGAGWITNDVFEKTMVIVNVDAWHAQPDTNFNIFRVVNGTLPFDRLIKRVDSTTKSLPDNMKNILNDFDLYNDIEYTSRWLSDYSEGFKKPERELCDKKMDLHALKYMTDSIVYLTNTEPSLDLTEDDAFVRDSVDTFILPCSGLYQFMYLQYHIDSMKHVIFYDVNPHSVEWFKVLVAEWDGVSNPVHIMRKFEREYIDTRPMLRSEFDEGSIEEFMELMSEQDRVSVLNKLREITVEYQVTNICKDSTPLTSTVSKDSTVIINYTNIMQYESNFLNSDIIDVDAEFYNTISMLNKKCHRVYLQGDSPHGININCADVSSIKGF